MTDVSSDLLAPLPGATAGRGGERVASGGAPARGGGPTRLAALVPTIAGMAPFTALVVLFLVVPTAVVVVGAFTVDGRPSLSGLSAYGDPTVLATFARSFEVSASTALIGAVVGALVAHVVASAGPDTLLRRAVTSACGVLAQFGGVTLAFAFIATIGVSGVVTVALRQQLGIDVFAHGVWLFSTSGLVLVYTYFQVPLMVIVFLPALDGVRPQWREATTTLGGSTWQFWRHVGLPVLAPPFTSSALLLFANALSAYATAAALVDQGAPIVPLQIRAALTSEVLLGRQDLGDVLALGMVVVVAVVMAAASLLERRSARWAR